MKVKVTSKVAEALDKLEWDEWSKQFNLIGHCKNFSGNGKKVGNTFNEELSELNSIEPIVFAKILINGYEAVK
ncbi:hypothetical protein [Paenibacillus silvae]|uniref:Uncharacterized protein n=1 Tax=Paenibacillus silvae TaxID=1325358 RepID=A0A2W6PCH1_9BACL|nr:hypothetical protein [Paenibacillus silvae]PZT57360.1 hypothetical protein DN757_01510 [Paenibacillus silvae]